MAMPRSARLIGSTSLTPSPIMATRCPLPWSASTMATFCCGDTRPKTLWLRSARIVAGRRQLLAGDDRLVSQRQVEMCDGRPHRLGIVAGDDLERDALGLERFRTAPPRPQFVAEGDQGQRTQHRAEVWRLAEKRPGNARDFSEQQHAQAIALQFSH